MNEYRLLQLDELLHELARCEEFLAKGGTQAEMNHARAHIEDLRNAVAHARRPIPAPAPQDDDD